MQNDTQYCFYYYFYYFVRIIYYYFYYFDLRLFFIKPDYNTPLTTPSSKRKSTRTLFFLVIELRPSILSITKVIMINSNSSSSNTNSLIDICSARSLEEQQQQHHSKNNKNNNNNSKSVLLFGAEWHEACPMLKMVLGALAASNPDILFGSVDAEVASDLSEQFGVDTVPTIILLLVGANNNHNNIIKERLEGEVLSDPSHVTLAVRRLAETTTTTTTTSVGETSATAVATADDNTTTTTATDPKAASLNDRLERLVRADTVMVFMKGNPSEPRCGFSRQAVELLRNESVPFGSFDVLSDNDVRQGLKTYSDWPTFPQIVSYLVSYS